MQLVKTEAARHATAGQIIVIYDVTDDAGALMGVAEERTDAGTPSAVTVTYTPESGGPVELYAIPTNARAARAAAMTAGEAGLSAATGDGVAALFDRGFGVYTLK